MAVEFEEIMDKLGNATFDQAETEVGNGSWLDSSLDARFNKQDGSWSGKIRATKMDGTILPVQNSLRTELLAGRRDSGRSAATLKLTIKRFTGMLAALDARKPLNR